MECLKILFLKGKSNRKFNIYPVCPVSAGANNFLKHDVPAAAKTGLPIILAVHIRTLTFYKKMISFSYNDPKIFPKEF